MRMCGKLWVFIVTDQRSVIAHISESVTVSLNTVALVEQAERLTKTLPQLSSWSFKGSENPLRLVCPGARVCPGHAPGTGTAPTGGAGRQRHII